MTKFKITQALRLMSAIALILGSGVISSNQVEAAECSDLHFVFARGSGEPLAGSSYNSWHQEITAGLAEANLGLTYQFYELGAAPQYGAQYPAVAISGSLGAFSNLLGAFVSGGAAFEFGASVNEGSKELLNYIHKVSAACPETKFVLGGYSQGAMLISRTLSQINPDKIIYVATFGDPKLYLPEGQSNRPVACTGKNLSNYRAYVPDCHAYEGALGSYRPYQPTGYYNKLGTFCNSQDIICSSGMSISDHTAYVARGLYKNAATIILAKIRAAFRPDLPSNPQKDISAHDLLLVFDMTNTMRPNIDNYVAEAKSLVNRTRSLGGRVAIYTIYQSTGYWNSIAYHINEICDFTCSSETSEQFLNNLARNLMPGAVSSDRAIYATLNQAMRKLEWQIGATKSAVVFAAEPPKITDFDGTTLDDIVELSLSIDPVNIYALTTPESVAGFEQLTTLTNGQTYIVSDNNTQLTDAITGRPVAVLGLESYFGLVGDEFLFDASGSSSGLSGSSNLRYDWDLDADGIFELIDVGAIISYSYTTPLAGFIQVRVTDESGTSSTMSARIQVDSISTDEAEIYNLSAVYISPDTYEIHFDTNAAYVYLALDDLILGQVDLYSNEPLKLYDVADSATLRFIPYSAEKRRGISAELILSPDAAEKDPSEKDDIVKDDLPQGSTSSGQLNSSTSLGSSVVGAIPGGNSVPFSPISIIKPSAPNFIPGVPNTGVYFSEDSRRELK